MNRIVMSLAVLAVFGTCVANAEDPRPTPRPQRIMIVNIAKVLRQYNKANFKGAELNKMKQEYVNKVNALQEQVQTLNSRFNMSIVPDEKKKLQEQALAIQRQIEDIDREAKMKLTKISNETVVMVYKEVKGVIADIAKTNNLDMVLCYPSASEAADEESPAYASLMLQAPALMPFYHSKVDITEVVVQTLNARYPSPAPPPITPVSGTEPAPRNPAGK